MEQQTNSVCASCKKVLTNMTGTARFRCPQCTKTDIIRCSHCRKIAAKYTCPSCNFEGPN